MPGVILDLCGGTGSWSQPYRDAGYHVLVIDPADYNPTPEGRIDVREFEPPDNVHGILAAPPCTHFSISGARWWKEKGREPVDEAVSIVEGCLRVIRTAKPKWWALENPRGRIGREVPELGGRYWTFSPWQFGDPWQKETCIWGWHVLPLKKPIPWPPNGERGMERWKRGPFILSPKPSQKQIDTLAGWGMVPKDWRERFGPNPSRRMLRSMTPPGFAKAFFNANP